MRWERGFAWELTLILGWWSRARLKKIVLEGATEPSSSYPGGPVGGTSDECIHRPCRTCPDMCNLNQANPGTRLHPEERFHSCLRTWLASVIFPVAEPTEAESISDLRHLIVDCTGLEMLVEPRPNLFGKPVPGRTRSPQSLETSAKERFELRLQRHSAGQAPDAARSLRKAVSRRPNLVSASTSASYMPLPTCRSSPTAV